MVLGVNFVQDSMRQDQEHEAGEVEGRDGDRPDLDAEHGRIGGAVLAGSSVGFVDSLVPLASPSKAIVPWLETTPAASASAVALRVMVIEPAARIEPF